MKIRPFLFAFTLCPLLAAFAGETEIPLDNPGFEQGEAGWTIREKAPMSSAVAEAAHEGTLGLRVTDEDTVNGSSALSQIIPVEPGQKFRLTFWARTNSANVSSVNFWFFTQTKKVIGADTQTIPFVPIAHGNGEWFEYQLEATAPPEAVTLAIWIHSYSTAVGTIDFDDFKLVRED